MILASTGSLPPAELAATAIDAALVFLLGVTGIVLAAGAVACWCGSAWRSRFTWQTALVAVGLLLLVETTGLGAMGSWLVARWLAQPGITRPDTARKAPPAGQLTAVASRAQSSNTVGHRGTANKASEDSSQQSISAFVAVQESARSDGATGRHRHRVAGTGGFPEEVPRAHRVASLGDSPRMVQFHQPEWSNRASALSFVVPEAGPHGRASVARLVESGQWSDLPEPPPLGWQLQQNTERVNHTSAMSFGGLGGSKATGDAAHRATAPNARTLLHDGRPGPENAPAADPASDGRFAWWARGLALLWCLGTLVGLAKMAADRAALWLLCRRHTTPCSETILAQAGDLARRLGIRRAVFVGESKRVLVPMAFGIWRPVVVVPAGFEARHLPCERQAVLAHELAHLAHKDPAWMFWAGLMLAVLWWHPAAWFLRRQLHKSNELVADEAAQLVPGGPATLAHMLVQFGRRLLAVQDRRVAQAAQSATGRTALGRRVRRLLDLERTNLPHRTPRSRRVLAGVLAMSVAFSAIGFTGWVRTRPVLAEGGASMRSLDRLWLKSLVGLAVLSCLSVVGGPSDRVPGSATVAAAEDHGPEAGRERRGPREGDRPERPRRGRPPEAVRMHAERVEKIEHERNKVAEQIEQLEARLRELGDRNPEEAEEIRQVIGRLHEQMEKLGEMLERAHAERPEAGPVRRPGRRPLARARRGQPPEFQQRRMEVLLRQRKELEEQAERLERELREVAGEHPDRAERIERQLRGIRERLERMPPPGPPPVPPPQQEQFRRRVEELKEQLAQAEREGAEERAERLRRQIDEIVERLERGPRPPHMEGPPRGPRGPEMPPEELERRIRHLEAAIDNLHAAGMHEAAEMVEQALRRLRGEPVPEVPGFEPPGPPCPPGPPPEELFPQVEELHRAVGELGEQIHELRGHMEQMQRALEELIRREEIREREQEERERAELRERNRRQEHEAAERGEKEKERR